MVDTDLIETKSGAALGIKINLPNVPLMVIRGENGYLACGYIDKKVMEKVGDCGAVVSGVKSLKDMLRARSVYATKKARKLGVRKGMTGVRALDKFV